MERLLDLLFLLVLYVFLVTGQQFKTKVWFEARDERVFDFYPPSVWEGEVKARQLGSGSLSLCADEEWSAPLADQVCNDIGFAEGAMLYGKTEPATEEIETASCVFLEEKGFCRKNQKPCHQTAWVSCQFPGFFGCYPFYQYESPDSIWEPVNDTTPEITIEWCIKKCHRGGVGDAYRFAGLQNGHQCFCSRNRPYHARANNKECMAPCRGNKRQACGGQLHISVYEASIGSCGPSVVQVLDGKGYLTSPGFPGNYDPGTKCYWSFGTTFFNMANFTVIGLANTPTEDLMLVPYQVTSGMATSELKWKTQNVNEILRGTTKLTLNDTLNAGILAQFIVKRGSLGNKQFIITFQVNDVPYSYTPEAAVISPVTPTSNPHTTSSSCCVSVSRMVTLTGLMSVFVWFFK